MGGIWISWETKKKGQEHQRKEITKPGKGELRREHRENEKEMGRYERGWIKDKGSRGEVHKAPTSVNNLG